MNRPVAPRQQRQLQLVLAGVFVLLLVPAVVLAYLGYRQLQFEAFFQYQALASELTRQIDRRVEELFAAQDDLSYVDFSFLVVGEGNYVQRSPLSEFPANTSLPGLVGYFQVDADGTFSTPILPARDSSSAVDLEPAEYQQRLAVRDRLLLLLTTLDADSRIDAGGKKAVDNLAGEPVFEPVETRPVGPADKSADGLADELARELEEIAQLATGMRQAEPVSADLARPARQQHSEKASSGASRPPPQPAARATSEIASQAAIEQIPQQVAELFSQPTYEVTEIELPSRGQAASQTASNNVPETYRRDAFADAELDSPAPVAIAAGQAVFDQLDESQSNASSPVVKVAELKLKEGYASKDDDRSLASPIGKLEQRTRRLEKNVEASSEPGGAGFADAPQKLTSFVSEVEPFRMDIIDAEHFLLHRNVWREQRRVVQGAVIERKAMLDTMVGGAYQGTGLASVSSLLVAFKGDVMHSFRAGAPSGYLSRADEITGTLLYQSSLTTPLNDLELIFSVSRLPMGPGGVLIGWTSGVFLLLLCGGFALLYRLGNTQIALAEQQQDFVAAVSHELKTPLTSIRMYGEILQAGWASEEKKRSYYDFIFTESERLTRLINNVLRLARINRNGSELELRCCSVGELVDIARSKCTTQLEQAGFELDETHEALDAQLNVDADAFVQIMINLIDNAIKFSATSSRKSVCFATRLRDSQVEFAVRDYGPGVPKNQLKKIFRLFYRTERELTRETVGTGIGLALVHELVTAMGGTVDVRNADPGAEFRFYLPLAGD